VTARTCEASSSSSDGSGRAAPAAEAVPPAAPAIVVLDRRVRRLGRRGEVLLGGEPFRLLRLSERGARLLDALARGGSVTAPEGKELARRLVLGGFAHPVPPERSPTTGELTVVVPVRDDDTAAARLLEPLRQAAGPVIVVDDGSLPASACRLEVAAAAAGATLVRRHDSAGPASARNAARPFVDSPLVAFVDADVVLRASWLDCLLGHFDDAAVAAVAPRVRAGGTGGLAGYESLSSPLDLGEQPGLVGAHRRLSYVPSAAIVVRRAALEDVGWFDPELRVGEDVDLLRRLEDAGWTVRYEPRSVVGHDSRPNVVGLLRQRFSYGTSAAALERRHPGTVAPYEGNWWSAAALLVAGAALVATGRPGRSHRLRPRPGLAAALAAGTWLGLTAAPVRSLRSKLGRLGVDNPTVTAAGAVARGQLWAVAGSAAALRRVWWPPALGGALALPRLRRPVAGALAAAELAGHLPPWWRARRAPDPPSARASLPAALAFGLLDDLAYGAGVWAGCVRHGSLRAVLPRLAQRPADSPSSAGRRSR